MRAQATASQTVQRPTMDAQADWVCAEWIGGVLNWHKVHVGRVARQLNWRTKEEAVPGGRRKVYHRIDVAALFLSKGVELPPQWRQAPAPPPRMPKAADVRIVETTQISESARQTIDDRKVIIDAYLDAKRGTGITMRDFWEAWQVEHPDVPPYKTFVRWMSRYRSGGVNALVDLRKVRTPQEPKVDSRLRARFLDMYLNQNALAVKYCYWWVQRLAAEEGIPCPSLSTFRRLEQFIPVPVKVFERQGAKAYDDLASPYISRCYDMPANDWWVSDHHQLDMACRTNDGRVIFPWATVWMDIRSRVPVGIVLCETPNSDTIFTAFQRAALKYQTVPAHIYLDNGKDYRSHDLAGGRVRERDVEFDVSTSQSLMSRLGIGIRFARPYNARAKIIERQFRIWKEQFCRLHPSYRGGNVLERKEELSAVLKDVKSLPLMSDLETSLIEWVDNIMIREPVYGLPGIKDGMSRIDTWHQELGVMRTGSLEQLRLMTMRQSKPVKVQRNGVMLNKVWYDNTEALHHLIGRQVFLRWDPQEAGRVYVYDLDGRFICEAENVELLSYDATSEDIKRAEARKRKGREMDRAYMAQFKEFREEDGDLVREEVARRKGIAVEAVAPKDGIVYEPLQLVVGGDEYDDFQRPTAAMAAEAQRRLRVALDRREQAGGHKWKPRLD